MPLETPLGLEGHVDDGVATVTILDGTQPLTSVTVDAGPSAADPREDDSKTELNE